MLQDTATAQLVTSYGYLAVLLGTMLEGETVVLVAGFMAHQGYLSVPWIIVCAVVGSTLSDQGMFFLSRFKGRALLARFPRAAARVSALAEKMRARPVGLTLFALLFRFFYGLRNIAPVFLGLSCIPTPRFMALNALGAVVWATLFSWGGYLFAQALAAMLGTLARYEVIVVALLLCAGAGWGLYRRFRVLPARPSSPPSAPGEAGPGQKAAEPAASPPGAVQNSRENRNIPASKGPGG